jgi:protein-L-isoaspartate(D-aspartate) O-methyltransferase
MIRTARALDEAVADRIEAAAFVMSLRARGLRDAAVLGVMERVPRELFAPRRFADLARSDIALPLACGQTMTAPGTVATMLVALAPRPGQRVLEIGTGSGYVSALLARLGCRVHTIERYASLAQAAVARFGIAGLTDGITAEVGDGLAPALPEGSFDRILVNGSVSLPCATLTALIGPRGRLVGATVVEGAPRLLRLERAEDGHIEEHLGGPLRLSRLVPGRAASL